MNTYSVRIQYPEIATALAETEDIYTVTAFIRAFVSRIKSIHGEEIGINPATDFFLRLANDTDAALLNAQIQHTALMRDRATSLNPDPIVIQGEIDRLLKGQA